MSNLQEMSSFLFIGTTRAKVANCIQVASIVLHEAKTVLGLFCVQLNTNGWSGHETSRICKKTIGWSLKVCI